MNAKYRNRPHEGQGQTQSQWLTESQGLASGARAPKDAGFTLIEIMVYLGLVTVILVVVGSIFSSLLRVQGAVVGGTSAAENSQLVSKSVENGIRNGTAVSLQSVGSDQLVFARTAGNGSSTTWRCQAWYYDATNKEVRFTYSPSAIATPNAAQLANWQLLSSGITPSSGSTIFSLAGSRLSLAFNAKSTNTTVVTVQTSVAVEAGSWVSSPCF